MERNYIYSGLTMHNVCPFALPPISVSESCLINSRN